jgi:hypothetical protein
VSGVGETYECQVCHGTFAKTRSDEEALAEMRETWRPTPGDDDPGIVCDDCFQRVMAWARSQAPETLR